MITILAKNVTKKDIMIEKLGISIPSLTQIELVGIEGIFSIVKVISSKELKDIVAAGNIIINDGVSDLSTVNGLKHLSLKTEYTK